MREETGQRRENTKIDLSRSPFLPAVQTIIILIFFEVSFSSGSIIYDTDAFAEFLIYAGTLASLPILTYLLGLKMPVWSLYSLSLEIFLYALMVPLFLRDPALLPLLVLPVVLSVLKLNRGSGDSGNSALKVAIFLVLSTLMYVLGSFMQFIMQPAYSPTVFASLTSIFIFPGQSMPPLYYLGMDIYGPYLTITVSPIGLFLFAVISALVSENYDGFFRVLRKSRSGSVRSILYGVTATLSCQCEACISLLPALAFVILTVAMVPLILESFLLLVLSNLIIRRIIGGKPVGIFENIVGWFSRNKLLLASVLLLPVTPAALIGIYLGLLSSPVFFFGMGMANTLSGYVLMLAAGQFIRIHRNVPASIALMAIGMFLSLIWYLPSITYVAFSSGAVFSAMVVASLASGVLFGLSHLSVPHGHLVAESVSLVYGIFIIFIFYLTVDFRYVLWGEFPYGQTVIFEIVSWAVMLPIMWFFTQVSILRSSGNGLPEFTIEQPLDGMSA